MLRAGARGPSAAGVSSRVSGGLLLKSLPACASCACRRDLVVAHAKGAPHGAANSASDGAGAAAPPTPRDVRAAATSDRRSGMRRSSSGGELVLTEPVSALDVDQELWQVLDMCSDDDLEHLYAILFGASPFSPLVKTLVAPDEPAAVERRGRASVMHKIESRFRFLSADSTATLRGKWPSYRESLLLVRDRLGVDCSSNLSTEDLETELFLHILQNCSEYIDAAADLDGADRAAEVAYSLEGDGMTSSDAGRERERSTLGSWADRLLSPLRVGVRELLPSAAKLGSAVAVSAVGRKAAEKLAGQLLQQHVRWQSAAAAAAAAAARAGGAAAGGAAAREAALVAAQRGLTSAAARYGALRGAMAFVGPVMWGWLAVDLGMMAIGTDYARIIRAVFVLAQVRLLCTHGWVSVAGGDVAAAGGSGGGGAAGDGSSSGAADAPPSGV